MTCSWDIISGSVVQNMSKTMCSMSQQIFFQPEKSRSAQSPQLHLSLAHESIWSLLGGGDTDQLPDFLLLFHLVCYRWHGLMLPMALHNTKGLLSVPMAWRSRILNYLRQIKWLLRNFSILPFRDLHRVWWNGCLVRWLESQCVIAAHPTEIISRWSVEIISRWQKIWKLMPKIIGCGNQTSLCQNRWWKRGMCHV